MDRYSEQIEAFLATLKAERRSSPNGMYWNEFYQFLKAKKMAGQPDPPVPLILAAAGESNARKHERLSEQLRWASENGLLDNAIQYLQDIPIQNWSVASPSAWEATNY